MNEFLKFFDEKKDYYPMCLSIEYSTVTDYTIYVCKRKYYQDENNVLSREETEICRVSDCDIELCFAKAHVELKEWFIKNEGGY